MLGVLLACTFWMNLASYLGVPVSITNALVGSMVGFGSVVLGNDAVHWNQVTHIAVGWITSPLIAGITAYGLFISIQQTIFVKSDPLERAKLYIPIYLFLVGCILSFITVFKGLNHFGIHLNLKQNLAVTLASSITLTIIGMIIIKRIPENPQIRRRESFLQVEKYFAVLMAMTAGVVDALSLASALGIHHSDVSTLFSTWNPAGMLPARINKITSATFHQPTWELDMARKDARLMMEEAQLGNMPLMVIPAIAQQMDNFIANGHGHDDWTVIGKDSIKE